MAENPRVEELRRRVQSDPASIAFAALAEEYRRSGQYDQAIATCLTGLKRHPSYLSAHVTLGRTLMEVGRYDEACDAFEFVLRTAPENLAAIRGLAEIHRRRDEASPGSVAADRAAPVAAPSPTPEPQASHGSAAGGVLEPPVFGFHAAGSAVPEASVSQSPVSEPSPGSESRLDAQLRALEELLAAIEHARGASAVRR